MPDVYRPEDADVADTHVMRRVSACSNPDHTRCLATGARHRPGAHRMRHRPARPAGGSVQRDRVPLWRRPPVVRKMAMAAGITNAITACLCAVSGSWPAMMVSIALAVVSFVVYLLLLDNNIE